MLKEIEQQVTALIAKQLPDAGVTVALRGLRTEDVFQREQQSISGNLLERRRLLPITFAFHIAVRVKPSADTAAAVRDARELLLEQVARIAHILGDPDVRSGEVFASKNPDSGLAVESFVLAKATIDHAPVDDAIAARLRYHGTGNIWPPGNASPTEGTIETIRARTKAVQGNASLEFVPKVSS